MLCIRLPYVTLLLNLALVNIAIAKPPVAPEMRKFDRALALETEPTTSAGVSVGDINGDGNLDILLAKGRHWPVMNRVMLGNGQGEFSASDLGGEPDRTYTTALADIDGNGSVDLVVSNDRPDRKLVYTNDGSGRFRELGIFGDPEWPTRYVTLADINGDGFPDILVANRNNWRAPKFTPSYVCFNDGKGGFADCRALPTQSSTTIVASDFDGDGAIDLFLPHRDGGRSLVLWNDSMGNFNESSQLGPEQSQTRVASAADLNGDGSIDLLVGGEDGKGIEIYLNEGKRQFSKPSLLSSAERVAYSVAIADLNGDAIQDVAVGYVEGKGTVFFGTGSGRDFVETPWNDGAGSVYGLAIGDFNGDGRPDIVAARSGAVNALWYNEPSSDSAK